MYRALLSALAFGSVSLTVALAGCDALTPDGRRAYATNIDSNTVSVIDVASNTVIASIPVDDGPLGVAITPDGAIAYVTNVRGDYVSLIDCATNTLIGVPIGVDRSPIAVAITR